MNVPSQPAHALIVGSVAYDSIITPYQVGERILGGSASYAAFASSYYAPTRLVGVVGNDFDTQHIDVFKTRNIDIEGLKIDNSGPTFFWKGKYYEDFNKRETLEIELNVFERFRPELPESYLNTPYVMLGNIQPELQLHVIDQMKGSSFIIADTIDLWIETQRSELLEVIKKIDLFIINESEAQLLTGEDNLINAGHKLCTLGPKMAIIKKGEHGALLFHPEGLFILPSFPVTELRDPTGAGDTFAGALIGYLAGVNRTSFSDIKRAMTYATVTASLIVEAFSFQRLSEGSRAVIEERFNQLLDLTHLKMEAKAQSIESMVHDIAAKARSASLELTSVSTQKKNDTLFSLAEALEQQADSLLTANRKDLEVAERNSVQGPLLDRLRFTPERIKGMADGVRQIAKLSDPVGEEIEVLTPENGLDIRKVCTPIGVIGIIYESRPNVTVDCAALCLKSSNAVILRGGREAFHTNTALASLIRGVLGQNDFPLDTVQLIPTPERSALDSLLKLDAFIDCIIPRGGEGLIRFVAEHSTIPVIKHYKGVCNVYIDKVVNPEQAEKIVVNAKCQRPGVCNAIENLFIHEEVAPTLLPRLAELLQKEKVELRGDEATRAIIECAPAVEEDYYEEYLGLILAIKVVASLEEAIKAVNTYGSGHSDAILTTDADAAKTFMNRVDSATVYWNASTRFTDGFEFGLGAEIGISTDKLHARGPMGLRDLCTYKYLIYGQGQVK